MERRLNYLNVNINYLQVNLGNYYNSFSPTPNYIYLNNNLLIIILYFLIHIKIYKKNIV